ncbi:MAG TPA: GNAT family N-acetyltransferase [Chryseosolibacter sp.]
MTTSLKVSKIPHSTIAHLREAFLKESNIQFIFDKCHRYGWADTYAFTSNESVVGYGSVWGKVKRNERDSIVEFYLIPEYRYLAESFFATFVEFSRASWIECQTNDRFLYPMFEVFAENRETEAILFEDSNETHWEMPGTWLSPREQSNPDDCQYVLVNDNVEIGEGGFMLNYNFPYADMYYSVSERNQGKGFGTFFVQELKRKIYKVGRVPAARCNATNEISKATLLKAGMKICGWRMVGKLRQDPL